MKKIILTLAGFCFLFFDAAGQEIEWQKRIGGSDRDVLNSIQQTTDGGYIVGGYSDSNISGDKTENNAGGGTWADHDYWVIKLDASGNIEWQNTIGGDWYDNLACVQQTTDGGYILGGSSYSSLSGDKTENSINNSSDYWIVKLDNTGNIQWQNTIGGSNNEGLSSLRQTLDGGYIIGGSSYSNISGDKTENTNGYADYWVLKLDISGNIQWQNTIGGDKPDELTSIRQSTDGGYIIGGWSNSGASGDKTEGIIGGPGAWDYWVVKLDSSGNIQWENTIGGNSSEVLMAIEQTNDGGYILGGYSSSDISADKTENCWGGLKPDYWVIKLDNMGSIEWQNTIGGTSDDYLRSIKQTNDGGYILGGWSASGISGDKTENSLGVTDSWTVKLDSSGIIQWQKTIGAYKDDILNDIQQTTDNGYILGGSSWSDISGDITQSNRGVSDYWVVKLTDNYNLINGKLFYDLNSNQVQDAGEPAVINTLITESNTGRLAVSQQNGIYNLSVLDSGNFNVHTANNLNYYTANPVSHSAYFSTIHQTDSLNDFAFQPAGVFNDLCVTITPMGNFRANMNANYMIAYENVGTTTLNGTVIFFPDNNITFVSSNPTPTSVSTDSVVWNVGTLTPFQAGSILITVHVNAGTPIGELINSSVVIEPVAGDANTACNYNSWEVFVTGAVDPNAILVDRDTVLTTELSSPPYLNYIIYFQNTGNDTAFNARVLNNIPQMLDVNSFEFVASSHPVNINYGAHARLFTFTFDNILLPDSNVNEPASHGFIRYRIKPLSTLVAGDSIKNKAAIYFDFNQPVLTDTAVTEIVLPTGVEEAAVVSGSEQLMVYPNPAQQSITIFSSLMTNDQCQMTIFDLFGREVFQLQTANCKLQTQIDVSRFSQGIYFVRVESGEKVLRGKFLKE